jgi:hypothetical protein
MLEPMFPYPKYPHTYIAFDHWPTLPTWNIPYPVCLISFHPSSVLHQAPTKAASILLKIQRVKL